MAAGGKDSQGVWEGRVHTAIFKIYNQHRPAVEINTL